MLKINHGQLTVAMERRGPHDSPLVEELSRMTDSVGYLDKTTGDIVHLYDHEGEAQAAMGAGVAVDAVLDRAEVAGNPAVWVEIPKYDGPDSEHEEYIRRFLANNGITEYELV